MARKLHVGNTTDSCCHEDTSSLENPRKSLGRVLMAVPKKKKENGFKSYFK